MDFNLDGRPGWAAEIDARRDERLRSEDRLERLADVLVIEHSLGVRVWEDADERRETLQQIAQDNTEEDTEREFLLGLLEDCTTKVDV